MKVTDVTSSEETGESVESLGPHAEYLIKSNFEPNSFADIQLLHKFNFFSA